MRTRNLSLPRALAASAFLMLALPASNQPLRAEGFSLFIDPVKIERIWTDLDANSSKFQEYRDLRNGLRLSLLRFGADTADFRRAFEVQVINADRDDSFYGLSYDVAGSYRFNLTYDKIPHRFGNDGTILYTQTSPGRFEIADPIQQALQTFAIANQSRLTFPLLKGALQPFLDTEQPLDIGLVRRRSQATFEFGKARNFSWGLEYRQEERDGSRAFGTSFGFNNVTELPEPIDYDTSDAILSADWKWSGSLLRVGYRASKFKNNVSTLTWDNPWRFTDSSDANAYSAPGTGSVNGSARAEFDLAADNDANSIFANGRFKVGDKGWLQASIDRTEFKQDDNLLGFTLNNSVRTPGGAFAANRATQPHSTADRESTMTKMALSYGTQFGDGWSFDAKYDYLDYADDSRRLSFIGYVRFDAVWEDIPRITVPFSWTRDVLSASIGKDFGKGGDLGLYYKIEGWDREFRETESTDEDLFGLTYDVRLAKGILRARYEKGDRSIDHYETEAQEASFVHPEGINNLPALRKYDQAARQTDRIEASYDMPIGERFGLNLAVSDRQADYDESRFGLTVEDQLGYNIELSYEAGAGNNFFVFANLADRDVSIRGRQSGATPSTNPLDDWDVDFTEGNDIFGLGWNFDPSKTWHVSLAGQQSKSDGKATFFSPPGGSPNLAFGFSNYEDYKLVGAQAKVEYKPSDKFSVGLRSMYEKYTIDSFIRQDLANYLPGALLIFANDGDYKAILWGLSFKVRM